jgi:hypothetical protein
MARTPFRARKADSALASSPISQSEPRPDRSTDRVALIPRRAGIALPLALLLSACSPLFASSAVPTASAVPTQSTPLPSPSPSPSPLPTPRPSPSQSPEPSPPPYLWVAVVYGGDYGFVSAQTSGGAVCNARATLPNGTDAPGLRNPQVASWDGMVQWTYPQKPTDEGIGRHTISCSLRGLNGSAWMDFEVGS